MPPHCGQTGLPSSQRIAATVSMQFWGLEKNRIASVRLLLSIMDITCYLNDIHISLVSQLYYCPISRSSKERDRHGLPSNCAVQLSSSVFWNKVLRLPRMH